MGERSDSVNVGMFHAQATYIRKRIVLSIKLNVNDQTTMCRRNSSHLALRFVILWFVVNSSIKPEMLTTSLAAA